MTIIVLLIGVFLWVCCKSVEHDINSTLIMIYMMIGVGVQLGGPVRGPTG